MRSRNTITSALLAALAVLAISAVASASASAAECPGTVEGGGIELCSGGHQQLGTFAFTGEKKSDQAGLDIRFEARESIACNSAKISKGNFVGAASKLEVSGMYIEFSKCHVEGAEDAACEVKPFVVDGGTGNGTGAGLASTLTSTAWLTLKSTHAKELWSEINIRSTQGYTCGDSVEDWQLKGQEECNLPSSTVEAVEHEWSCGLAGSSMSLGGLSVSVELSAEIKLSSGKKWSLQKI